MSRARRRKAKGPWRPVSEFDVDQHSECLVRCNCGRPNCRPMHAYWSAVPAKDGTKFRAWVLANNVVCGLYEIAEFKMIESFPFRASDRAPVILHSIYQP